MGMTRCIRENPLVDGAVLDGVDARSSGMSTRDHAADGIPFTEEDIERWGAEDESEAGYTGTHLGPSRPGRPVSVGRQARPFTLRLDAERRARLDAAARERSITPSQLVRDLIDAL